MPNNDYTLPVTDDASQRDALIAFLQHFEQNRMGASFWKKRLEYWWERNPYYGEGIPRRWLLEAVGRIAGFLGFISSIAEGDHGF